MSTYESETIPIVYSPEQLSDAIRETLHTLLQPVAELECLRRKECLTQEEVAKLYGISAATLRTKRSKGGGPCFRQGPERGSVYYTHDDIQSWIKSIKKRG